MMLKKKKKEGLDEDEEIEKLLRDADDAPERDEGDRYLRVKIEIEGLRELAQALEELVEAIKSKEK